VRLDHIAGIELMHRIRKGQFTLESFASMAKPRQKSGMQFSPHKPHNVPKRFVALIPKVCTRAPAYLAALPAPYSPELNPKENLWRKSAKRSSRITRSNQSTRARQTQAAILYIDAIPNRKIHHDFSLYRQVTLMWNWY